MYPKSMSFTKRVHRQNEVLRSRRTASTGDIHYEEILSIEYRLLNLDEIVRKP